MVGGGDKEPIIIVNRNRHFKMAQFWIDKLNSADRLILDLEEIEKFNQRLISKISYQILVAVQNFMEGDM